MQANEAKIGDTILYANMRWTVLDKDENGNIKIFALNLKKHCKFDKKSSNWEESYLRKKLPNLFPKINLSDLVEFERDLRTEEGNDKYGKCVDKISLISADEYRKYRKLIPKVNKMFWTLTATFECRYKEYEYLFVQYVLPYCEFGNLYCYGIIDVRPLCVLKSSTEIKICE